MDELQKTLTTTAAANGFANRILWVCVKRHGRLPEGGSLSVQDLRDYPCQVQARREDRFNHRTYGARMTRLKRVGCRVGRLDGRSSWSCGLLTRTGRSPGAPPLHDLCPPRWQRCHQARSLERRFSLWQYVEASVWYLFGTSLGDPTADTVLAALDQAPKGLTRNHLLTQTLHGNCRADELDRVLRLLQRLELVTLSQQTTGRRGRPAELITRTSNEVNEVNTPDYVLTSNDAVKRGYLSNEVIPKKERGNSQNGANLPLETPCSTRHDGSSA